MGEYIKNRVNFADVDPVKTAYIPYEPYHVQDIPKCTDYAKGKKSEIILRNKLNGQLERIRYKFCGYVPFETRPGSYWHWGEIEADDLNCYLVFQYYLDGSIDTISASFAGRSPTAEEYKEMTHGTRYAAEITTRGAF